MKKSPSYDSDIQEIGCGSGAEDQEEVYVVEKIIDKREKNGKWEYLLKWQNFADDENTWEPEENLECEELIKEFEKEQAKLRETRKRTSSYSTIVNSTSLSRASKERKRDYTLKNKVDKANKFDKVAKREKANKVDKTNKVNKAAKVDRAIKVEKSDNVGRAIKVEMSDNVVPAIPISLQNQKEPEKIVGATDTSGELMFLVKWIGTDEADLILARDANILYPQIVIKFYEERLRWREKTPVDGSINENIDGSTDENNVLIDENIDESI